MTSTTDLDVNEEDEAALLARCNRTRCRRRCIAAGDHPDQPTDGTDPALCPRCGL